MQALAEARHHLGDFDLSASQLLLFLAEEWVARRLEAAEKGAAERAAAERAAAERAAAERAAAERGTAEQDARQGAMTHVCQPGPAAEAAEPAAATDPDAAAEADPAAEPALAAEPPLVAELGAAARFEREAPVRHRIVVHRCPVCERAWAEGRGGPMDLDPHDQALASCDAERVAMDGGAGRAGRVSRTIPPAVRRLVLVRDGGRCQVPGCRNRHHLDVHHLRARVEGGGHEPVNLVTLCTCHHDMVHKGVIRLARSPGGGIRCSRGPGEPLGVLVGIQGDQAELEHADLAAFEGAPGSWPCISGYWGHLDPLEGAPSRGRQQVRPGDEARMAPRWMASAVRCR
ncbi:MAG: hypothetical protein ABIO70_21460 [Pseudomonadota bacterium]